MKLKQSLMALVLVGATLGFAACTPDDDANTELNDTDVIIEDDDAMMVTSPTPTDDAMMDDDVTTASPSMTPSPTDDAMMETEVMLENDTL